jgi:hypothetical protein
MISISDTKLIQAGRQIILNSDYWKSYSIHW